MIIIIKGEVAELKRLTLLAQSIGNEGRKKNELIDLRSIWQLLFTVCSVKKKVHSYCKTAGFMSIVTRIVSTLDAAITTFLASASASIHRRVGHDDQTSGLL